MVLATFLVLGVVCGVLWWLLVDPAEYTRVRNGGGAMSEVELSKRFNADGWYAVIAVLAGFGSGLGVAWWRTRDFRLTTLLLVPGAALAAAVMALVGRALGPGDPHVTLASAELGQTVPVQLAVTATPSYLVWPVAVLAGALMVLWSSPGVPERDVAPPPAGEQPPEALQGNHEHSIR
jgi:hypothetical protein